MKLTETLGLIGAGNMGGAILEGLIQKKVAGPDKIWVYDKIQEKAAEFASKYRVHEAKSNQDVAASAKILLLAVKPQDLAATAAEFQAKLTPQHIIISILAGTPAAKVAQAAGGKAKVVRAMPNLGAKVGESVTAFTGTDQAALDAAEIIFSACGKTLRLKEEFFDLVTAVSGSGPAYFFLLMELLAKEGVRHGLSQKDAELLAVQTAAGAAKLAQSAGESPAVLRERVTSKGGTTAAALKVFSERKLEEIVQQAVQAALDRGRELSK